MTDIVLRPLGVITQPNKVSGVIPPGAMSRALRARMRDPGTIESSLEWVDLGSAATSNANLSFVLPIGSLLLVIARSSGGVWTWAWSNPATNSALYGPNTLEDASGIDYALNASARWGSVTVRSRTLLTCENGTLVWDYTAPTSSAQATPRSAGLLPPYIGYATYNGSGTAAGALKANTHCHAVAVLRRQYADGYELVSSPSLAVQVSAIGVDCDIDFQIIFPQVATVLAGDLIEIYRTRSQPISTSSGTNTGADFYKSMTVTVTSANVAAQFTTFSDSTPDAGLGDALYLNSGVSGPAAYANPPPTARCIASYRGYTFYGNVTDPAKLIFSIPVFWGHMFTTGAGGAAPYIRKNGIGTRIVSGTSTIGSPTITGIPAADFVGICIGQEVPYVGDIPSFPALAFPVGSRIIAIGASTITVSANATDALSSHWFGDVMEINGSVQRMRECNDIAAATIYNNRLYPLLLDRAFPDTVGAPTVIRRQTFPAEDVILTKMLMQGPLRTSAISASDVFTIRATNGQNYRPRLPRVELSETAITYRPTSVPNGLRYSEEGQPENVPPSNADSVGVGEIYGMYATRDALWIMASDGLWRLSGTGGTAADGFDWRIDPVDPSMVLSGPLSACVLRDVLYAYTSVGLVAVDSSGASTPLSHGRIGDVLPGRQWSAPTYTTNTALFAFADVKNDEVWLRDVDHTSGRTWIYNTLTDSFCEDIHPNLIFHGAYSSELQDIYFTASSGSNQAVLRPSTLYGALDLVFQPLNGGDTFEIRQWQVLDVAFEVSSGFLLGITFNGISAGPQRLLSNAGTSEFCRAGFGVPRNAPAIANNIVVGLFTASSNTPKIKMQGFVMRSSRISASEQRKRR